MITSVDNSRLIELSSAKAGDYFLYTSLYVSTYQFLIQEGVFVLKDNKYYIVEPIKIHQGKIVHLKKNSVLISCSDFAYQVEIPSNKEILPKSLINFIYFEKNRYGFIVSVISSQDNRYVYKLEKKKLVPQGSINVILSAVEGLKTSDQEGDLFIIEVSQKNKGKIIKRLGNQNNPENNLLEYIVESGIPYEFSEEALREATLINEEKIKLEDRLDLRKEFIFTIDGDNAKDFDDAISISKTNNIYTLGVHIADVSHYVLTGSCLDNEAFLRGNSNYLLDSVIPMLPFNLSNGICSLNPDVERLTLSCIMKINEEGIMLDYSFYKSIIKSSRRLTYKKVNKLLKYKTSMDKETDTKILLAQELAKILRKEKEERGYIDLDIDEPKFILKDNKVVDIVVNKQDEAEKLIEDFMVLANETVAEYIENLDLPFIYRIHDNPEPDKIVEFSNFLKGFKIHLSIANQVHPSEYQKILRDTKDTMYAYVVKNQMLRSFPKAKYSNSNIGHFGLGSSSYTHFTSPIRRYADLMVHRLLKQYLIYPYNEDEQLDRKLSDICFHISETERTSINLERTIESVKKAEYLSDKINYLYEGIISGVLPYGFFVMLDNTIQGYVSYQSIYYDYLTYDKINKVAIGEKTGVIYYIGMKVKVKVSKVNEKEGQIDFTLVRDTSKRKKV
ncbi:MAG: ribonuclease R [Bacillales bacterium]|jgi:ribonuclease R|nr:ribonuclease R [Bacillales bacterium]